jgi:hypothetical protein
MLQIQRLVDQAAEDDGTATHVAAASVLRAAGESSPCYFDSACFCDAHDAGVVNADDLKRFASYFWSEESNDVVEKDEAMRCLRAFLQVKKHAVYLFIPA